VRGLTTEEERAEHKQIMDRLAELDDGRKLTKKEATERRGLERRRQRLLEVVRQRRSKRSQKGG
jgi:hypothetical protein